MKKNYVRNEHGVKIKMCCASCRMRKVSSDEGRVCKLSGNPVKGCGCCNKWQMNQRLQNAGMSGGQIKSWRYLTYYRERWTEQREAVEAGRIQAVAVLSAKEIRMKFEQEHGSIYINF